MKRNSIIIGLVVLLAVAAPIVGAAGTELLGSTDTTQNDFNDGTLNGLQTTGAGDGAIAHTHDSYTESNINQGTWDLINGDSGTFYSNGNTLQYEPEGGPAEILRYTDRVYSGGGGEFYIRGDLEYFEYENDNQNIDAGYVLEAENGVQWRLVMRGSHWNNPWQLRRVGPSGNIRWLSQGFGGHNELGGPVDVRFGYDDTTGQIRADIYGPSDVEAHKTWNNNNVDVKWVGLVADGGPNGNNWIEATDLELNGFEATGGTYQSAVHNVDGATKVEVDTGIENAQMDIVVTDGSGNELYSGNRFVGGTWSVPLDTWNQADDEIYIELTPQRDSQTDRSEMWIYETRVYYENRDPQVLDSYPSAGQTFSSASVPLEVQIDDDDFGTNGDSVNIDWYVNGNHFADTDGITSAGTFTKSSPDLPDGDHTWHVEVTDSHGGYVETVTYDFTVQHGPTEINNVQPPDATTSNYETNTLSADIDDPDFTANGGSGDTVTVEFIWNGNVINSQDITSPSTVSHDAGPFPDGTHEWYVRATDSYGGTYTSQVRTLTIDHDAPTLTGESPTGTVEYEDQTLSVDVDDADFGRDGDTVDVTFTLDGSQVATRTLSSAGTASVDVGPLDDGSHTWDAQASDDYGYTTSTSQTFTVEHHDPSLTNPSPSGTFEYKDQTLSVDLTDEDFTKDGDSIMLDWYLDGSVVATTTADTAGTYTHEVTGIADGAHTWKVEASDQYGRTDATADQSLDIEHNEPAASNPSVDGVTHYSTNTLSVDVDDADFTQDGDTVTAEFYVDGQKVDTKTTSSSATLSTEVGPRDDGSYTWHVELSDQYGLSSTSPTWDLTVQHDDPALTNADPDGVTHYAAPELSVDVSDADFDRDGDSVEVVFEVDGVQVGTDTVTANATASVKPPEYEDGTYTWTATATDEHGYETTSGPFTMDVTHRAPTADSFSDPGTTDEEFANLEFWVSDDDFLVDGDTVTATWFLDGNEVHTEDVTSDSQVGYTAMDLSDGEHTWRVELEDEYGYSYSSQVMSFEVNHYPSTVDNSTMEPAEGTTLTEYKATFNISVEDPDFGTASGDTVTAELFVEGSKQGETTVTQNGTASTDVVVGFGGDVTYWWEVTDSHGFTARSQNVSITSPGSLNVYEEENPDTLISNGNASATFYFEGGSGDLVVERDIVDGTVDMGGLPTDRSFVAVISADDHYNRRVYVESLFESDDVYMIGTDEDAVQPTFTLLDYTGDFGLSNSVLKIQKSIDNEWRTVDGDYFGATNELPSVMAYNDRHRLILLNTETGARRNLGTFFPLASGEIRLDIHEQDETIDQTSAPAINVKPDTNRLPSENGTAVSVTVDPRDSGITNYTVATDVGGVEVNNATYDVGEKANMTLDLADNLDDDVSVAVSWAGENATRTVTKNYTVQNTWPGRTGIIGAVQGIVDTITANAASLIGLAVAVLLVMFTAPYLGVGMAGTVAFLGVSVTSLLGLIPTPTMVIAGVAWVILLATRWRA